MSASVASASVDTTPIRHSLRTLRPAKQLAAPQSLSAPKQRQKRDDRYVVFHNPSGHPVTGTYTKGCCLDQGLFSFSLSCAHEFTKEAQALQAANNVRASPCFGSALLGVSAGYGTTSATPDMLQCIVVEQDKPIDMTQRVVDLVTACFPDTKRLFVELPLCSGLGAFRVPVPLDITLQGVLDYYAAFLRSPAKYLPAHVVDDLSSDSPDIKDESTASKKKPLVMHHGRMARVWFEGFSATTDSKGNTVVEISYGT